MKQVVSISIGSSKRDHSVELDVLGQQVHIWREGTDGDMKDAARRLREYDGKVDAFGMGGIDLFLNAAGRTYWFRDAKQFRDAVSVTPLLDGSGLKGAVEGDVVRFMQDELGLEVAGKHVLVTSAVDRWGMAMAFAEAGCEMTYGDLLYALDVPIMIHGRNALVRLCRIMAPAASQLPFKMLYPAEADHTSKVESESKHAQLYRDNDIITGDYKFVRKYMPKDMTGKWIVTNTTTAEDVEFLRGTGAELLITSTPRLEGRTFGTNAIEATLVALEGATSALKPERYLELLGETGFKPDVIWLQKS
jgi:hypothetical protein